VHWTYAMTLWSVSYTPVHMFGAIFFFICRQHVVGVLPESADYADCQNRTAHRKLLRIVHV
jgi:hypothetical protein